MVASTEIKPGTTLERLAQAGVYQFPYTSKLSFHLLIEFWENLIDSDDPTERLIAREIKKGLKQAPELRLPIEDNSLLEKHDGLLKLMLSAFFPAGLKETQISALSAPFNLGAVYRTPRFNELLERKDLEISFGDMPAEAMKMNYIKASSVILKTFYNTDILMETPFLVSFHDVKSGLDLHYKPEMDVRFSEVVTTKPIKKLSRSDITSLLNNIENVDRWMELLPPDNFQFHGLIRMTMTDFTEEEAFSRIKYTLLDRDAALNWDKMEQIEQEIRTLFRNPALRIGLTGMTYAGRSDLELSHNAWRRLVPLEDKHRTGDYSKSAYAPVFDEHRLVLVDDLKKYPTRSPYEDSVVESGVRALMIAPLKDEKGKMVGVLELGSKKAEEFDALMVEKVKELIPVFAVAVQRSIEETKRGVEVMVKEKFTAIHPSVEWRFQQAATNLLERQKMDPSATEMEPIAFKDVYPFYAQSDIVSSSTKRNEAIQADLLENLNLARKLVQSISGLEGYPLVDQFDFRIGEYISNLQDSLNSGDEVRVMEFLNNEIDPFFDHLIKLQPGITSLIQNYRDKLNPILGVIYSRRQAYEESVQKINETLTNLVELRQKEAQAIIPHYYEKYQTDGIEFNMYLGQSILENEQFDEMYIENARLWQLMLMCEITRKIEALRPGLRVPMTTAQLILVYSNPIAIRFKPEEKQFDVDGAYNIRYEVIKKRIDKSVIRGTNERLTQAGKVAVVYTQEKDKEDYLRYMNYLQASGYIDSEVEQLELAPLQGVVGLKALRFTVAL
ncbi:MAG: GAF domain-containing protein [Bacteroidota bacterium]